MATSIHNYDFTEKDYTNMRVRIMSFKQKWVKSQNIIDMVYSGFYFTGKNDSCRCAYCGLTLSGWEEKDNPIEEHFKNAVNCSYITQKMVEYFFGNKDHTLESVLLELGYTAKQFHTAEGENMFFKLKYLDGIL